MLDIEIKNILQEQFSKEKNYQQIIYNLNKKQNKNIYIKIIKYALLPTCAILVVVALIQNYDNKYDYYKDIAYIDNTKTEGNDQYIKSEIDNNEIIKNLIINTEIPQVNIDENKIETGKNNEIEDNKSNEKKVIKNNDVDVQIATSDIYKTIQGGEASWVYDPTIPENIIKDNKTLKYIVKAQVISVGEGEILPKQENFYNPFTCHTPIKMKVIDNLLETNKLSGTITAYITGGKIKIANILKGTKQEIEYMGIGDVSQIDKEKYIEYIWSVPFYEPNVGDEYVIIIGKANENLYQICCDGYGIFKVEKLNNQEKYINVVTNKEWKIQY